MILLEAMAHMEGFYITGSRPQRNNNPLDLEWNGETAHFGATGGDPRFAIFSSVNGPLGGWNAGKRWLSVPAHFSAAPALPGAPAGPSGYLVAGYLGATLQQALWRFAPPGKKDGNNPSIYLNFVCTNTGWLPTTILTESLLTLPEGA